MARWRYEDPEVALTRHLNPFTPRTRSPYARVNKPRNTIAGLQEQSINWRATNVTLPKLAFLERTDEEATSR